MTDDVAKITRRPRTPASTSGRSGPSRARFSAPRHLAQAHGLRYATLGPLMPVHRRTCLIAAVLLATGCAHPSCLRRDTTMLTDQPEKPRNAVFGMRSYSGSRAAFLLTAEALFKESPGVKLTGDSTIEIYAPEGSTPGYAAASVLCESKLSVKELVTLGQSVEERLADPKNPGARSSLRVDLMWVDGVDVSGPTIQLPHPDLLTKSVGSQHLHPGGGRCGQLSRRGQATGHGHGEDARAPRDCRHPVPGRRGSRFRPRAASPHQGETWTVEGRDWPDGLAAAAYAVGVIRWAQDTTASVPSGVRVMDARNAAKRVRSDGLVRVEAAAAANASNAEIARRWLDAVRDALRASKLRIATAVVYEADGGRVRGAVVGERVPQPLDHVRIVDVMADRDPSDTRGWAEVHGFSNITRVGLEVDPPHPKVGPSEAPEPR